MTQMEAAKAGRITSEMKTVASYESVGAEWLCNQVAKGEIALVKNENHQGVAPLGVGGGLRTKVNANIGTSTDASDLEQEIEKARVALEAKTDALMDLSTAGDLGLIRRRILREIPLILGTVPIYEAAVRTVQDGGGIIHMKPETLFDVLIQQAEEGVDFFTVHCGLTLQSLERLKKQGRLTNVVSRGGSFLMTWMIANEKENPLYSEFDHVLEIAKKYDVTLSLGDGLRPGSIADATDRAQIQELLILGELTQRAREANVQVMIEGPGHVPLDQIRTNMQIQKKLCQNAPFYVLGPLVTDIAPGYDHITSAIGGALAASEGADFLCYVTPCEHLKLPNADEVREGVMAARIAAHAADLVKGVPGAVEWDYAMSSARRNLDWNKQIELSIDPVRAAALRKSAAPKEEDVCTMCGDFCAIKLVNQTLLGSENE
ncbi:phosphomethylpyrimidine synthase ThiC [candidate division KSB1 bacterium]|nr:phosphomethylpyrimidine synthase ThiC [candidate division KSB1 bacterium]